MSDEKPPVTEGEKPQSPAVVKSATDTKAKPKRQPPAKPSGKTAATPVEKAVENAVEIKLETRVENPGGKSTAQVETPKRDFVDDAFSVFGWVD